MDPRAFLQDLFAAAVAAFGLGFWLVRSSGSCKGGMKPNCASKRSINALDSNEPLAPSHSRSREPAPHMSNAASHSSFEPPTTI